MITVAHACFYRAPQLGRVVSVGRGAMRLPHNTMTHNITLLPKWHIVAKWAEKRALWYSEMFHLISPSRGNYCTLGPFCARNPSFRMAISHSESSKRGSKRHFLAHICLKADIRKCYLEHPFRLFRRQMVMKINAWLRGRKRLQVGLQTFAIAVANTFVRDRKHRNTPCKHLIIRY